MTIERGVVTQLTQEFWLQQRGSEVPVKVVLQDGARLRAGDEIEVFGSVDPEGVFTPQKTTNLSKRRRARAFWILLAVTFLYWQSNGAFRLNRFGFFDIILIFLFVALWFWNGRLPRRFSRS